MWYVPSSVGGFTPLPNEVFASPSLPVRSGSQSFFLPSQHFFREWKDPSGSQYLQDKVTNMWGFQLSSTKQGENQFC